MPDLPFEKAHPHPYADRKNRNGHAQPLNTNARTHNGYAELSVTSNFTFLTGASHPDELVAQAAALGYAAVAITDKNSLAGIVRAHVAAKETGIQFIVGARLELREPEAVSILVYPTDRASYGRLCRLLTLGKRRAEKGDCVLYLRDLLAHQDGLLAVIGPTMKTNKTTEAHLQTLRNAFDDDRLSLAITQHFGANDAEQIYERVVLAKRLHIPIVAVNDVHCHLPERKSLQDVLTCVRHHCTLSEAGFRLFPNGERYLKPFEEMARLFADHPDALTRTLKIANRAKGFNLDQLRYEYPDETCPPHTTPMDYLRQLTSEGARERYPTGIPEKVKKLIEHEFTLIEELNYAPYFLTVHDLVRFARSRGILCQGRGAAANSAVCFCLGVTSVDPGRSSMLFERFVSREREEPPDIDIDFANDGREKVIQYIYAKYGRDRAGMTAVVSTYRRRSAIHDVGKALGLSHDTVIRIAKRVDAWEKNPFADSEAGDIPAQLVALGFDPKQPTTQHFVRLVRELVGFPRHLSQHVGGFVMTRGPLCELIPIENAAMEDRTVIEWDKDDIEALGILKVDVLGLGMLTCIHKCFELIEQHTGRKLSLATIPAEDARVYDMISRADTIGVFQIESRAQMSMTPRLKPNCFYDLVIEVAIVRPGPIVGQMVHPYLRRRTGEEPVHYHNEVIKEVLGRTLGVPIFQEQVMALAMRAAGFSAGEAEKLRRAITAWTSKGDIAQYPARFIQGMLDNGYPLEFAQWCFERLKGFSQYGFPESHAASFALLVYASAWLKCYYPAAFAAALLNSQPMGFYAPAQLVRDAIEHDVVVKQLDVNHSDWDCTLENEGQSVRLGLRMVNGLRRSEADKITQTRNRFGGFSTPHAVWIKSNATQSGLETLACADAFQSMGLSRRKALWHVQQLRGERLPLLDDLPLAYETIHVPAMGEFQEVIGDYQTVGLSLRRHPLAFIRSRLEAQRVITAEQLRDARKSPHGRRASIAGIALCRQRPGTAQGVMFMTIEDETGRADLIVRPRIYEQNREAAVYSKVILVKGRIERQGLVVHILAEEMESIDLWFTCLPEMSRDFR